MENEHVDSVEPKGISRRTVAKTLAWSAPVVAAVAVAPAVAASGEVWHTGRVESSGRNKVVGTFTLPEDAKNITFVVRGGGGGGSSGAGGNHYAGGDGHRITGSLDNAEAGKSVTLTAGAGGGTADTGTSAAGGAGFGNGGGTTAWSGDSNYTSRYCRGGGGGGGSAIQVGGTTMVIAGGGGGAGGYAYRTIDALSRSGAGTPTGGNAGADGGYPRQTLTRGSTNEYRTNVGTTRGGGNAGSGSSGGAAPTEIPYTASVSIMDSSGTVSHLGTAGGAGNTGSGADGGTGNADGYNLYVKGALTGLPTATRFVGQSGGGGGGYAGGGAGAVRFGMRQQLTGPGSPSLPVSHWFAVDCGGGGGGSHYVATGVTASSVNWAGNGGAAGAVGGVGYVEITFSSATFTPPSGSGITWS